MENKNKKTLWRCGDDLIDLSGRTLIMGILNVTPDSFYNGRRFASVNQAVAHALQMHRDGADIIDVGGESTRPGSRPVSEKEELNRVIPVIERLSALLKCPVSIDTYKAVVARHALQAGATIVNDISGLHFDKKMAGTIAAAGAGAVIMHIKGRPRTMQKNPVYQNLIRDIIDYLRQGMTLAHHAGIAREQVVVDPGIGFGKSLQDNLQILRALRRFRCLGRPILVGPSRKTFIGMTLDLPVEERLEGTIAAVTACVMNGANILRIHDVRAVKRAVTMADAIVGRDGA